MTRKIKDEVNCNCNKNNCCLRSREALEKLENTISMEHLVDNDCFCDTCISSRSKTGGSEILESFIYLFPFNKNPCQLASHILTQNILIRNIAEINTRYHNKHNRLSKIADDARDRLINLQELNKKLIIKNKNTTLECNRLVSLDKSKDIIIKQLRRDIKNQNLQMSKMVYKSTDGNVDYSSTYVSDTDSETEVDIEVKLNTDKSIIYLYENLKSYMIHKNKSLYNIIKNNVKLNIDSYINKFFKIQKTRNIISHPNILKQDYITDDTHFINLLESL